MHTLLTHVHPDLDALLALYLLRKHGEEKFPGVKDAKLDFVSANELPGGAMPKDLEAEGILAVDTGGGRFDNHPNEATSNQEKWDTCASELVAKSLGVDKNAAYRFLL
ncbi:hypothetical protein GF324_03090, partial [bacterium]|nr:hypothetical protein [bacterium]